MEKPRITNVQQQPRFNERGAVEQVYKVTYWIGEDGPFAESFLAGDFTEPNVQAALSRVAETLHNLRTSSGMAPAGPTIR